MADPTTPLEVVSAAATEYAGLDLTRAQRTGIAEAAQAIADGMPYPITTDWLAGFLYGGAYAEGSRVAVMSPMQVVMEQSLYPGRPSGGDVAMLVGARLAQLLLAGDLTP